MYRLNYGNGQVSDSFKALSAAKAAYKAQIEFDIVCKASSGSLRIQRYEGDGEWSTMKPLAKDGPRT